MPIVYSDVPPLRVPKGGITIQTCLDRELKNTDALIVATGYASKNSIIELNSIVKKAGIQNVILVLGMYYVEGAFPESIYNAAIEVNDEWKHRNIGQIRIVKSMKYHGKIYGFYHNGILTSSVIGSHNLGSIVLEASNRRQYEISLFTDDDNECLAIDEHLKALCSDLVSIPIDQVPVTEIQIIREENQKLRGVEGASKVSLEDVQYYKHAETKVAFDIPLKVPGIPGDSQDYMKSNVNKCYAKGRLNSTTGVVTERGWWETEIVVSKTITKDENYPKGKVFYVVTDDGWGFKAHTSGTNYKNLESHDDLKILGYWLKGRLVASGLIEPVDSPADDLLNVDVSRSDPYSNCKGVITYAKLKRYGRTSVTLAKTTEYMTDEDGSSLEVWTLSFLPNSNR